MRTQYRVALCSFVTIIICAVVSVFFVCYKYLFIEKWFDYLIAISLGLLTNSVLIFAISIINFYQIRRERSRRIIIELNIFQTSYLMLNALMLPLRNDAGVINIPDSAMNHFEKTLERLDDISLRTLYLDRISLPTNSFIIKHPVFCSKTTIIEKSFFEEFSEFIRQCHIAYQAFRITHHLSDPIRENFQTNFQNSISKIIEFSSLEGDFNTILNKYLDLNKKILKIDRVSTNESATAE